jgi:hypothetical protein
LTGPLAIIAEQVRFFTEHYGMESAAPPRAVEEVGVCPLCGSAERSRFESLADAWGDITYQLCGVCGLVYQSPRPNQPDLERFYAGDYRRVHQETEEPTRKDLAMQAARAAATLAWIRPQIARVDRHLDVGSSSGALLAAVRHAYGSAGVGVEPGEAYRRYSRGAGFRVYSSLEELDRSREPGFDLLTIMHVLEHLPDPVDSLRGLRERHAAPGALLVVEVPNLFEHAALERAHMTAFSPSSLRAAVARAGFDVVASQAHGSFRSPILRLFLTVAARARAGDRPPPRIRSSPVGVRLGRRLGAAKRRLLTRLLPDWTWQDPERKR